MCRQKVERKGKKNKKSWTQSAKVIAEKGLEKTTMEEIIAGTTLSKGGVYHYYGSVIEIFKDIMLNGIKYRDEIIREHLAKSQKNVTKEFMAKELVTKIIDDNLYMPLYIEFLIAKKEILSSVNLWWNYRSRQKKDSKYL